MTLYNYSSLNSGDFGGWFSFANTVTNDLFFSLVTIGIFLILLIIVLKNGGDVVSALMGISWVMFIFSSIAWFGGWLNIVFVMSFLVLSAGAFFYKVMTSSAY